MTIRQAAGGDIPVIEDILADAVEWMDQNGLHQWEYENVRWTALSRYYAAEDFYIAYEGKEPAACMALVTHDPILWPTIQKGESLFLHKLAVKRSFAGKGVSKRLIEYAKQKARALGMPALRLDCHRDRSKVRTLYEGEGFVCVGEKLLFGRYDTAFYRYDIPADSEGGRKEGDCGAGEKTLPDLRAGACPG